MKEGKRGGLKNRGTANASKRDSENDVPATDLAEAFIMAAEQVGEDGKGRDGLSGFFRRLAKTHPQSFVKLSRGLPETDVDQLAAAVYRSVYGARLQQRS